MRRAIHRRILVIDDEPAVHTLVRELLESLGYVAEVAEDGVRGLALWGERSYDLVLIDLQMPRMGGWDVAERIRRQTPDMPIVIISGFATDDDAARAGRLGVPLLHKPFSLAELEQAMARALASRGGRAGPGEGPSGSEGNPGRRA